MANVDRPPQRLVFVRHGQSAANLVQIANKSGDNSGYTDTFRNTPNSEIPLTETGIEQAQAAGRWLRENVNAGIFDGYYVSSFVRARQTAGHLGLPEGKTSGVWKERDYLREQSWGHLDGIPIEERHLRYPDIMATKLRDRLHWTGLGGESMAQLVDRTRGLILPSLYRDLPGRSGVIVSHGNTLWAIRIALESIPMGTFLEMDEGKDPFDKINNAQILEYTSENPKDPADTRDNLGWMRSVCPWDTSLSSNEWREIVRPKFTNAQLLGRSSSQLPLD